MILVRFKVAVGIAIIILCLNYRVEATQCLENSLTPDQWSSDSRIDDLRLRDRSNEQKLVLIARDFVFTCKGTIERWAVSWSHREARPSCASLIFQFIVFRQNEECDELIVVGSNSFDEIILEYSGSSVSRESQFTVFTQRKITVQSGDFIGLSVLLSEWQCSDIKVSIAGQTNTQNTIFHGLFPSQHSINLVQPCSAYTLSESILPYLTAYLSATDNPSPPSTTSTNDHSSITVGEDATNTPVTTTPMSVMSSSIVSTIATVSTSSSPTQSTDGVLYSNVATVLTTTTGTTVDMKVNPSTDSTGITHTYSAKVIGSSISTSQTMNSSCTHSSTMHSSTTQTSSTHKQSSSMQSSSTHRSCTHSSSTHSSNALQMVESMNVRAVTSVDYDMVIYVGVGVGVCLILVLVISLTSTVLCIIRCTRPKRTVTVQRQKENGRKPDYVEQDQPIYDQPITSVADIYTIQTFECPSYNIEAKTGVILTQIERSKNQSSDSLQQQQQRAVYKMTINEAYNSV